VQSQQTSSSIEHAGPRPKQPMSERAVCDYKQNLSAVPCTSKNTDHKAVEFASDVMDLVRVGVTVSRQEGSARMRRVQVASCLAPRPPPSHHRSADCTRPTKPLSKLVNIYRLSLNLCHRRFSTMGHGNSNKLYVTHAEHSGMFGQHTASSSGHRA
jgi:hypothetical protein